LSFPREQSYYLLPSYKGIDIGFQEGNTNNESVYNKKPIIFKAQSFNGVPPRRRAEEKVKSKKIQRVPLKAF